MRVSYLRVYLKEDKLSLHEVARLLSVNPSILSIKMKYERAVMTSIGLPEIENLGLVISVPVNGCREQKEKWLEAIEIFNSFMEEVEMWKQSRTKNSLTRPGRAYEPGQELKSLPKPHLFNVKLVISVLQERMEVFDNRFIDANKSDHQELKEVSAEYISNISKAIEYLRETVK